MTLDELINSLLEAKEHCVDGRSIVYLKGGPLVASREISDVKFNNDNVYINYE